MSLQLLRRAWDALDSFKQAYPKNWHEDDQQVMDDLLKADLDLSGVKRTWIGLTDGDMAEIYNQKDWDIHINWDYERAIEAKLRSKNENL